MKIRYKSAIRAFKSAPRGSKGVPRCFQEASKRLSRAFGVEIPFRTPFWTPCWSHSEPLGPGKSSKFVVLCTIFEFSAFSDRVVFGPRFGHILDPILGAIWPLLSLKTVLELVLERPRASQEHFGSALEASKSSPRGHQEASRLPRRLQELSKSPPRGQRLPEQILDPSR